VTRWRICSIGQTAVYVHIGCWLCAGYFLLLGYGALFVFSMASVIWHECSHAAVATAFGKPPAELELTPLGAVMRLDDDWMLPVWKQCCVLAAGPAASLLLCGLCLMCTKHGFLGQELGKLGFVCNLVLAMGNLLPALPLDGGRLLGLVLNTFLPGHAVRRVMRCLSMAIGMLCVAVNVYISMENGGWNLTCGMVGCFIMYAACKATTTAAMAEMRMFVERKHMLYRKGAMGCRLVAVAEGTALRCAMTHLRPRAYTMYAVVQPGSGKIMKWMGEDEAIAAYLREPGGSMRSD